MLPYTDSDGVLRESKADSVTAILLFLLVTVSFSLRPQMLGYLFLILTLIAARALSPGKSGSLSFLPPADAAIGQYAPAPGSLDWNNLRLLDEWSV